MDSDKRVTLNHVASRAGVSAMTVSRVLRGVKGKQFSEATRQGVLQAARELDYRPNLTARRLAQQKSNLIGVLAGGLNSLTSMDRTDAAVRALLSHSYDALVWSTAWSREAAGRSADVMLSNEVEGIVLVGRSGSSEEKALELLLEAGIPIVSLDSGPDFPGAGVDRRRAFYDLTSHLLRLGHRHFAYLGPVSTSSYSQARLAGIEAALQEAEGKATLARLEVEPKRSLVTEMQLGAQGAARFLEGEDRPSAVIAHSDLIALGFMNHLARAGVRVPQEVAIVSFDGLPEGEYCLSPLTTVAQPMAEVARRAVQVLLDLVKKEDSAEAYKYEEIPGRLVIRESCGYSGSTKRTERNLSS